MTKSVIIIGFVSLLLAVGVALLSPMCVPCAVAFLGMGAGLLAGVFDKPAEGNATLKVGALTGAFSGIGAALGQIIGAVINASLMGPEGTARFLESLGMDVGNPAAVAPGYWVGVAGSTVCFGLLDIGLMAGFGVLGALAWGKFFRKADEPRIEASTGNP